MYKMLQFLILPLCVITFFVDSLLAMEIEKEEEKSKNSTYRISNMDMLALMQKADKGNAEAQYQLAMHQLSGEGLKDEKLAHQEACSLLKKAADQNHGPARELLENLENNLEQFFLSYSPPREKKNRTSSPKITSNIDNNLTSSLFSLSSKNKKKSTDMESSYGSSPQVHPSSSSLSDQKAKISKFSSIKIDGKDGKSEKEVKEFDSNISQENPIIHSGLATQIKPDIDFEALVQSRRFRGEEFLNIEKQLKSLEIPLHLFVRYLKFWNFLHPSLSLENGENEKLKKELVQTLNNFFYNQCLPALKGDKFQEAKICLALSNNIKPYEGNASKNYLERSQRCLKNLLLEDKQIKKTARSEVLYWAWKYRKSFPDFVDSKTWQNILNNAANHSTPSPKAQCALGQLLEKGEEGFDKNSTEAQGWYVKAAKNGYKKAQLYLDYQDIKSKNDSSPLLSFYKKLAEEKDLLGEERYPRYPYAQFIVGNEIWSRKATTPSTQEQEVKEGILYLLSAARNGISEAQESLDQIREGEKITFYRWCNLSDQCEGDQERVEYLRKKADLAPYAYQLSQMLEDGRGVPFEIPEDWLKVLKEAKQWYDLASMYGIKGSTEGKQRIQQKIESTEKAKGYIFSKIKPSPNHPLFEEFSAFIGALYQYSPGARYLGTCIVQQLIESSLSQKDAKEIIKNLLGLVKSEEFRKQVSEEESEAEQATKLFEYIIEKSQVFSEEGSEKTHKEPTSKLTKFLSQSQGFIYKKIESSIAEKVKEGICQPLAPSHPLFSDFITFIDKISCYEGSVPEHGAYLVQQLLYFPPHSRQAKVLITSLLDLVDSKKFQKGEEDDTKEDIDDRQVEKLAKLNEAIELTLKPRKLLSPLKKEQEGGIPEKLKVNMALFRDPRVQVFNFYFEQEDKQPFDRKEFDKSVERILKLYGQLYEKGKITRESLKEPLDELTDKNTEPQHGSRTSLYDLLTNGEKRFGRNIPNHFGHRLIKIGHVLESGRLDESTLAAQLSSWAIAGISTHCATRSEGETHKFYNLFITEGKSQENENDTLEVKVAITLADLRRQFLHKIVPTSEAEPLHPINYLEKTHISIIILVQMFLVV